MILRRPHIRRPRAIWRDEDGSTLVEFGIVISLFLLIFFGLIDFGRLAYHVVTTERAAHASARIMAVRPPACVGVPESISRDPGADATVEYGTSCNAGGPVCESPGLISCSGDASNATAAEVWAMVQPTLPPEATIENLQFSYGFDPNLGFLGGPYVPVVTVALQNVTFEFVTPLSALAGIAGASGTSSIPEDFTLPSQSSSMPGEDLAQGENG